MQKNLESCLIKLSDESWRNISNSIVYIRCKEKLELLKKAGFDVDSRNDGFLAMCFVDHVQGVLFSVIAAAHLRDTNIFVSKENKTSSLILKAVDLQDCLYLNQNNMEVDLSHYYSYAGDIMKEYEKGFEEAIAIRDIMELDDFRNPFAPDEIEVLLIGSFGQERVYVRAERFGDNRLYGVLLDSPKLAAGLKQGDEIDFLLIEREGKSSTVHAVK